MPPAKQTTHKTMTKKLTLLLLALLPLWAAAQSPAAANRKRTDYQKLKLEQFFDYLNARYVDTLNNEKLVEEAIVSMLAELDPHSSYSSAEEMKAIRESFDGSFSGIGVEFDVINDTIIVVNTIPGGPAESVGVLPNDRIVAVDGKSSVGVQRADVPKLLRGPKGSKAMLGVARRGDKEQLLFHVTRADIPIHTVDAAYLAAPGIGYIRVNRFAGTTMEEFRRAFDTLGPLSALILDLRGNSGGLLDQAIEMSEFFLPAGSLVVSTEGRNVKEIGYRSRRAGTFTEGKLAVLTDSSSASGSEIVAGAVQDWDRGVIIGQPSFGKGLVQQQLPLIDGSAVRITVARYHTPSGRVIQRPFENGDPEGYYTDHIKRTLDNSYADSLNRQAPVYRTLRNGRKVLGGGGITPDLAIPLDTTKNYAYWNRLVRGGVINEYVNTLLERERGRIKAQYPTFERFAEAFEVTPAMLEQLTDLGRKRDIVATAQEESATLPELRVHLKALIARKLWDSNAYFRITNAADDREFAAALHLLQSPTEYARLLGDAPDGK